MMMQVGHTMTLIYYLGTKRPSKSSPGQAGFETFGVADGYILSNRISKDGRIQLLVCGIERSDGALILSRTSVKWFTGRFARISLRVFGRGTHMKKRFPKSRKSNNYSRRNSRNSGKKIFLRALGEGGWCGVAFDLGRSQTTAYVFARDQKNIQTNLNRTILGAKKSSKWESNFNVTLNQPWAKKSQPTWSNGLFTGGGMPSHFNRTLRNLENKVSIKNGRACDLTLPRLIKGGWFLMKKIPVFGSCIHWFHWNWFGSFGLQRLSDFGGAEVSMKRVTAESKKK